MIAEVPGVPLQCTATEVAAYQADRAAIDAPGTAGPPAETTEMERVGLVRLEPSLKSALTDRR